MGARYQEDANRRLEIIGTSIDKLVEKVGSMQKSIECKVDTSVVAKLDTRVVNLESKLVSIDAQMVIFTDSKEVEENFIKNYVEKAVAVHTA